MIKTSTGNVLEVLSVISSKNGDGLPVDAKQTKDHNHAPFGADDNVESFVVLLSS